jgi:hypothetical protein
VGVRGAAEKDGRLCTLAGILNVTEVIKGLPPTPKISFPRPRLLSPKIQAVVREARGGGGM